MKDSLNGVSYKFLDAIGIDSFAKSRERNIDMIASAKQFQTFPSLTQMVSGADWQTWNRTLGPIATYSQSFVELDFLVEKRGLPSVIEYFRLFTKLDNRERNFRTAFGEPVSTFTEDFSTYLRGLVGK